MLRTAAKRLGPSSANGSCSASVRALATVASGSGVSSHRIVIVGGGAAGQAVSHQLLRSGNFSESDIAIVEPSQYHNYQPGWTLVGGGLNAKEDFRKPMKEVVESGGGAGMLKLYEDAVTDFNPEKDEVRTRDGRTLQYEHLVVTPGLEVNFAGIKGLEEALQEEGSGVSSIYSYVSEIERVTEAHSVLIVGLSPAQDTCSRLYPQVEALTSGKAIFTQPAGVVKCAGAPQKVMWMALDHWRSAGNKDVQVTFASGMPTMFAVPKYSAILNALREERGVEGLFTHNLVSLSGRNAKFALPSGEEVTRAFDLLHVTPPMRSPAFVRESALADKATGFVDVNSSTTRHKRFGNVWSIGDASSLPTSKTVAAITGEAPVLCANLLSVMSGESPEMSYDGYTSCPLITSYGKVLLAEFVYDAKPSETCVDWALVLEVMLLTATPSYSFTPYGLSQDTPRRAFWHLKKDFFPWVYYASHVQGTWGGRKGYLSSTTRSTPGAPRAFSSSAHSARNTPSRRPRDPLLSPSSGARTSRLETGETFFIRPPPSAGSAGSTPEAPSPILGGVGLRSRRLPPPLHARDLASETGQLRLNSAQIAEMRSVRLGGSSAAEVAKQFGCSELFVSMVAPASREKREQHEKGLRLQAQKAQSWGERKRSARVARAVRREGW